jgi:hypothetical protein
MLVLRYIHNTKIQPVGRMYNLLILNMLCIKNTLDLQYQ